MRRGPLPAVIAALLAGMALAVLPADAADQSVSANPDDTFSPMAVTVAQGEMVTWTNAGGNHNVRFENESFTQPPAPDNGDWTVNRRFDAVGTFAYYCEAHLKEGMTGTVNVVAGPSTPPPPPPPGGGGGPAADTTAPVVSGFALARSRIRVGGRRSAFTFRLSEPASVRIAISRGVKRRGKTRYSPKGAVTREGLARGKRAIAFGGRIRGKALAPGLYRATIAATDTAGNKSATRRAGFRVVEG